MRARQVRRESRGINGLKASWVRRGKENLRRAFFFYVALILAMAACISAAFPFEMAAGYFWGTGFARKAFFFWKYCKKVMAPGWMYIGNHDVA